MAYDDVVLGAAANSKIIEVMLRDSTTGQATTGVAYGSVTYSFIREGDNANRASGTCVTMTKDTYADHGWVETDIAGVYQFGVPQAALATGKNAVTIKLTAGGVLDAKIRILIMGSDLRAAALAADLAKILGTAPTEGGAGRLAAAFTKYGDVATPVLTAESVNQTGDNFALVNADISIDSSTTPWTLVYREVGTNTVLLTKLLYDPLGNPVTSVTQIVGWQIGSTTPG